MPEIQTTAPDGDCLIETQAITEDPKSGDLTFWATMVDKQKGPNRKGFIFDWDKPEDVDVRALQANPVILYHHDSEALPVGRIEKIAVTSRTVRSLNRIPGYPELEQIRRYVRDGYLKGVSIGFIPKVHSQVEDPKGGAGFFKPERIQSFEIVELSLCPVGAHPTALIEQSVEIAKGAERVKGEAESTMWEQRGDAEGAMMYSLAPAHNPQTRDNAPNQSFSPADHERGDTCAVWEIAKAGETKGRFEHHDAKRGPSKLRVQEQMAVLLGARGGVRLDKDALAAAYEHLARHYTEGAYGDPPALLDYTKEQLDAMADDGQIVIPGRAHDGVGALVDKLSELAGRLEASLTMQAAQRAERQPELPPQPTPPPVSEPARELTGAQSEALRNAVRAILQKDPEILAAIDPMAEAMLDVMRAKNRRT